MGFVFVSKKDVQSETLWVKEGYPKQPIGKQINRPKPEDCRGFLFAPNVLNRS